MRTVFHLTPSGHGVIKLRDRKQQRRVAIGPPMRTTERRNIVKKIRILLVSFASLLAIFSVSAFGQVGTTSSMSGVVVDSTGAVIPGAEVTAKRDATGADFKTITVENGTFAIPVLDPGTYTVTVSLPGFKQAVLSNVKLDAGVPGTVRVTLEVGGRDETVTVEAGAEILQSQTANVATTIQVNQI